MGKARLGGGSMRENALMREKPAFNAEWASPRAFFTKDRNLLSGYYEVRQTCYRLVRNGPRNFCGAEDQFDQNSDILVVTLGQRVVGGARISGAGLEKERHLPLEQDGLVLDDVFPELRLSEQTYCEFSRMAILPGYRTPALVDELICSLLTMAILRGYGFLFAMSPLVQARCYRKVVKNNDFPFDFLIHDQFVLPPKSEAECGSLKMFLSSLQFPKSLNEWRSPAVLEKAKAA